MAWCWERKSGKHKGDYLIKYNIINQQIPYINLVMSQSLQNVELASSQSQKIKFNLDQSHLSCFISKRPLKIKSRDKKPINYHRPEVKMPKGILKKLTGSQNGNNSPYFDRHFNHKVLFTHYGQDQVYVDCEESPKKQKTSEEEETKNQEQIVAQCVRAITQETSDKVSDSEAYLNPQEPLKLYPHKSFAPERQVRYSFGNKDFQFQINLNGIERDGRTTIMLRNIPNKYTQAMILDEIDENGLYKKYDFFYLPIDYKNDCNVGYAFINLIHTKFIYRLFEEFNGKKWRRFNSEKICEVCYARLQGTVQLMNHFRYSNVLSQRDQRLKPLVYLNLEAGMENIQEIVQKQKNEQN